MTENIRSWNEGIRDCLALKLEGYKNLIIFTDTIAISTLITCTEMQLAVIEKSLSAEETANEKQNKTKETQ